MLPGLPPRPPRRAARLAAFLLLLSATAAACGTSATTRGRAGAAAATTSGAAPSAPARGSGPVNVLYAGSLVTLMERHIGPGFHAATGYTFTGFSAGSDALAAQIKGQVHAGDVFVSASPAVNGTLEGPANGNWVTWYATFATSPLVLGYNPHSRFTHDLRTKPWYQVVTEPGFLLGRTDPATDPKGKLAVQALDAAAAADDQPALRAVAVSPDGVFPEETLVGRLQAGQLDAGFFYSSEAKAAALPTVPLTGQDLKATYTVTVLNRAPNAGGADSFVEYLLGPTGRATLERDGFDLVTPVAVTGTGVPPGVDHVITQR